MVEHVDANSNVRLTCTCVTAGSNFGWDTDYCGYEQFLQTIAGNGHQITDASCNITSSSLSTEPPQATARYIQSVFQ